MELSRADLARAAGGGTDRRQEQLAKVEREIRQAQAEALGRAGERLQALLEQIREVDRHLDLLAAGEASTRLDEAATEGLRARTAWRNRLRDDAARLQHDLIIQREALGLRRHTEVEQCYPVPARRPPPATAGDRRGSP